LLTIKDEAIKTLEREVGELKDEYSMVNFTKKEIDHLFEISTNTESIDWTTAFKRD